MAYEGVFNASRVNRFSNPNLTCRGLPCGLPVGHPEEAYGALAIHNVRNDIAAFRPTANSTGLVTLAEHCDYGGYNVGLPVGSYTLSLLSARGIRNHEFSPLLLTD